ncbi:MAG: hypothetical protein N2712_05615 [Brevinematales bacterium]|nr:hypothetical protein [Brevinematales bacterium]
MKKLVVYFITILILSLLGFVWANDDKSRVIKYFETYRVIGKGKDLKESREDAYQNAIIEFLRKTVSPKDLKDNSEKILREIFASRKITNFVETHKIISSEEVGDSIKIIVDVVLRTGKIVEILEKIEVPIRRDISIDTTN